MSNRRYLPEEIALVGAWVFLGGSLVWLAAYIFDYPLLGYTEPWTWLAAAHFAAAGFGALTITALTCKVVADRQWLRRLRLLLVAHPIAYLTIAAGISGWPFADEIGSSLYAILFVVQLCAYLLGKPNKLSRGPRILVGISLTVPVVTMVFALAWGWGRPIFEMDDMVRYHGIVNAIGHVGLGFIGFGWGAWKERHT